MHVSTLCIPGLSGFGTSDLIGHLDFFPNGGEDQPGCKLAPLVYEKGILQAGKELYVCEHSRSSEFFIESIHSTCPFIAIQCENYEKFIKVESQISH